MAGLSVDGDMQGVDRLYGALIAHMWPGMILKSGNKITNPSLIEKEGEGINLRIYLYFSLKLNQILIGVGIFCYIPCNHI